MQFMVQCRSAQAIPSLLPPALPIALIQATRLYCLILQKQQQLMTPCFLNPKQQQQYRLLRMQSHNQLLQWAAWLIRAMNNVYYHNFLKPLRAKRALNISAGITICRSICSPILGDVGLTIYSFTSAQLIVFCHINFGHKKTKWGFFLADSEQG